MAVSVLATFSDNEFPYPAGVDYVTHDDGSLGVLNKPLSDETAQEIATYAPGQWRRASLVDGTPPSPAQ